MCWRVATFYTCGVNTFCSSTFCILTLFIDWIWCARLVHWGFDIMHWGLHWCLLCTSHWTLHWNATKLYNFIHGLHERLWILNRHGGLKAWDIFHDWDFFFECPTILIFLKIFIQKTCFALTPLPLILRLISQLMMTLAFGLRTLFASCMSSQVCKRLNTCLFPMNYVS